VITGIENVPVDTSNLLIWPNPSSDHIKVTSDQKNQSISIFSISGVKAKEFKLSTIPGVENELFIGDLYPGIYLLQVQNEDGKTTVRKIIKQ